MTRNLVILAITYCRSATVVVAAQPIKRSRHRHLTDCQWRDYSRYWQCDGLIVRFHRFVAGPSSARALSCIWLSRLPEKARVTAYICDHSEELADMWHSTVHRPDTLDFSRTSKQDHVRACVRMCAHVRLCFGDVAVLLRNSKYQKVRKHKSEKRWGKLDLEVKR